MCQELYISGLQRSMHPTRFESLPMLKQDLLSCETALLLLPKSFVKPAPGSLSLLFSLAAHGVSADNATLKLIRAECSEMSNLMTHNPAVIREFCQGSISTQILLLDYICSIKCGFSEPHRRQYLPNSELSVRITYTGSSWRSAPRLLGSAASAIPFSVSGRCSAGCHDGCVTPSVSLDVSPAEGCWTVKAPDHTPAMCSADHR
ncbi:hypothetical protein AOLI_G00080270 [Acnodon oligacanthus]